MKVFIPKRVESLPPDCTWFLLRLQKCEPQGHSGSHFCCRRWSCPCLSQHSLTFLSRSLPRLPDQGSAWRLLSANEPEKAVTPHGVTSEVLFICHPRKPWDLKLDGSLCSVIIILFKGISKLSASLDFTQTSLFLLVFESTCLLLAPMAPTRDKGSA